jgi:ATP-dependent Lhr-like helicase
MSHFESLHPALRYHIVNTLGWGDLRPTQSEAIAPIQGGTDVLLLAPTAGGKTEAAFLPLLSRAASQSWTGLSVLYVCPLKALLNNLEPRLARYAGFVGRRVGIWHGDVGDSARRRMLADTPDIILTTPESVEAILISTRVEHRSLFASLRAVVVDELHAFAGDDRGWHLLALLARLERIAGRRLQRVGLSATIGNPVDLLEWFTQGRGGVTVGSSGGSPVGDVMSDYVGSVENAVTVLSRIHRGERRLIFADSRSRVEELASGLRLAGVKTFVSHGSLSADERRQAEAAFATELDCAIVATSTLELGIDVGDLDRVIQVGAPSSVASFLQRMGRSGRRPGAARNFLFLATTDSEFLLALGITALWRDGFVEHVIPPPQPAHIYAQQIMALVLQENGITLGDIGASLGTTFDVLSLKDRTDIVDHMLGTGILHEDGGALGLGGRAEREFGRRHFGDLVVSFSSPMLLSVMFGRVELGAVHPLAVAPSREGEPVIILLSGRSWRVVDIDWPRRRVAVVAAQEAGKARWLGGGRPASFAVSRAAEAVIAGVAPECNLSRRAASKLDEIRNRLPFIDGTAVPVVDGGAGRIRIWTFAGARANASIGQALPGSRASSDDFCIDVRSGDARSLLDTLSNLSSIAVNQPLSEQITRELKFSQCLPAELASSIVSARLLDRNGIEATLSRKKTFIREFA